jgi:hypothetical protein
MHACKYEFEKEINLEDVLRFFNQIEKANFLEKNEK